MKKEVLIWIICIILLTSLVSAKVIDYETEEIPILEMYLYSWGLGETTEINLDNYFSIKREPDEIYISSTPPEISIYIDQKTGIAKLVPRANWAGTKRIIFTLTNKILQEEAKGKIEEYKGEKIIALKNENILKQIEYSKFKNNTIAFKSVKKLLENLERNLGPEVEVSATKKEKLVAVNIGKNIKLDVGFERKIVSGLTTEKPKISLDVNPTGVGEEEIEGSALSLIMIIPIIFIILSILIIIGFYTKDHFSGQINRIISKFKQRTKKIDIEKSNYIKIKQCLHEIEKIKQLPEKEASKQLFNIIKEFLKALIKPNFAETYSGLDKKIMLDSLDDNLKNNIIKFSKEISDLKFSGKEINKKEINNLISKTKIPISLVLSKKKKYIIKERRKEHWFIKILNKFKKESKIKVFEKEVKKAKREIEKEKLKLPKIDLKKFLKDKLGFKRQEEKIVIKEHKLREKEKESKRKEHEREIKSREKRVEKLRVEREKQRLKQLKLEERRRKTIERKKAFRRFLHNNLGIYKSKTEIEKIVKQKQIELKTREEERRIKSREKRVEKLRVEREKQRTKQLKLEERKREREKIKKAWRNFWHDNLGIYKSNAELEEIKHKKSLEKAKKTKERQFKEREKYRKRERKLREKERKEQEQIKKSLERKKGFRRFFHDNFGLYKTEKELIEERRRNALEKARKARERQFKEREIERKRRRKLLERRRKEEEKIEKVIERKKAFRRFLNDKFGLYKTKAEIERIARLESLKQREREKQEGIEQERKEKLRKQRKKLKEIKEEEKIKKSLERKKIFRRFLHDHFGLYKTEKELEQTAIQKALEKTRKRKQKQLKEQTKQREEERRRNRKEQEKEIKEQEKIKKSLEKAKKTKQEQLIKEYKGEERRKEKLKLKQLKLEERERKAIERKKAFRRFLHDHLGVYKSKIEIEKIVKQKQIELKTREEERRIKSREKRVEKLRVEREKQRLKQLKLEERRRKTIERKKAFRTFFHDNFGLYKTEKELIEGRRRKALEKARKVRAKEVAIREAEREKIRNLREKRVKTLERKKQILNLKRKTHKFLRNKLGFFKTKEEKEIDLRKSLTKKEQRKEKSKQLKEDFHRFIHDKIGLFRTPEEKIRSLEKIKQKRLEKLKQLKKGFLTKEIEKLKSPDLGPEEKTKILEQELRKSLRKGDTERAEKIDKELNKFYKKIPKKQKTKTPNFLTKFRNKIKEIKFRPEYKEFKEKIFHPKKEHKEEENRKKQLKDLIKQTEESLERGTIKEAESLYDRTIGLARGTSSKLKRTVSKEMEIIEKEKEKIEEGVRDKFNKLTSSPIPETPETKKIIKDNIPKIEKLIFDIKKTISKDVHKAKRLYEKATHEFKKIPEELPETTHQRLYSQLKPLKNEILKQSIPHLLKQLKQAIKEGKLQKARQIQEQIDNVYSYLTKQKETYTPLTSPLFNTIQKTHHLINNNQISEAKEIYRKIIKQYNSLPEENKKLHYQKISDLYKRLIG